ncbi:MAG TPA: SulP family inorganic anion transporter [Gaiellaceae bacterium]
MARDGDQEQGANVTSERGGVTAYGDRPPFRPARAEPLLTRALPLSADLPRYRAPSARRDLVAGVTVATLGIPSAMAYGELAGLSPVNGFYALLVPSLAYVLLGSSRVLVVGPEGSVSTVVAAAILPLAVAGSANAVELASMLALLVGACFLLARLLRLGWLADYFSRPVLIGYIHGVAVVLVIGQIGKLLGLSISARDPLDRLAENARELGEVSGTTVAVAAVALAVLLTFRFFVPRVPGAMVVVVGAIGVSWALDLAGHGVAVVGLIPSGLPRPTLPRPGFGDVAELAPAALGVFLVSFADEILTARSFAGRRHEPVRASQELLAMGAANAAAGFTQGFSVGAAGSRTAVNDSLGVRTQVSGVFAAGTIVCILLFLTGPVQYLPTAVLGAIIVSAGIGLVDLAAWRTLAQIDRVEVAIAGVTASCVVIFGVLQAIIVAVGLSVVDTVRRSARPYDAVLGYVDTIGRYADVSLHPSARINPGVVVYRLDDRLFFANANYVRGRILEAIGAAPTETRWLVFDAESIAHVDSTGMEMLADLAEELRRAGITLVVARLRYRMRDEFELAGVTAAIGADRFYQSVERAVEAYDPAAVGGEAAG